MIGKVTKSLDTKVKNDRGKKKLVQARSIEEESLDYWKINESSITSENNTHDHNNYKTDKLGSNKKN